MSSHCSLFQNVCHFKIKNTTIDTSLPSRHQVYTIQLTRKRAIVFANSSNTASTSSSVHDPPSTARKLSSPHSRREATTQQRIAELSQFVDENNHADVPYTYPGGLGRWAAEQRHRWHRGRLPTSLYRTLASLGFPFDSYDARWGARFRQLAAYHSQHGHCHVAHNDASVPAGLYAWILVQRQRKRQGSLDDARARRLDGIGFPWDVQAARVEERISELERFAASHGHARVPRQWSENPTLGSWVETIRIKWRDRQHDGLTSSQQAKLRALGVEPATSMSRQIGWDGRVAQLTGVLGRKGNLIGRLPNSGAFTGLQDWATRQRALWREGKVSSERVSQLEALGFEWDPDQAAWQRGLAAVDEYIAARGMATAYLHLVLLGRETLLRQGRAGEGGLGGNTIKEWGLGQWVQGARKAAKLGRLSETQASALAARGLLPGEEPILKAEEEKP